MGQKPKASAPKRAIVSHGNPCGGNSFVARGPKGRFMCRPRDIVRDSFSTAQPAHQTAGKKPPKGGFTITQNRGFGGDIFTSLANKFAHSPFICFFFGSFVITVLLLFFLFCHGPFHHSFFLLFLFFFFFGFLFFFFQTFLVIRTHLNGPAEAVHVGMLAADQYLQTLPTEPSKDKKRPQ